MQNNEFDDFLYPGEHSMIALELEQVFAPVGQPLQLKVVESK